jgi:hypothetical protein
MIGDGGFNNLVSSSIDNYRVLSGDAFSVAKRFIIPASGVVDFVFDPTQATSDQVILLPLTFKAFQAGPIYIDIYFGTDSNNDGVLLEGVNRDLNILTTGEVFIRQAPTINNTGVLRPNDFVIFSDGVAATAIIGGESSEELILKIKKDQKYLIRLTNQEASPAFAHIAANWFEINNNGT